MTITITSEIAELVNQRVNSGAYPSAEEVILTGLRLLEAQEHKFAALRQDLQAGRDDLQAGRVLTINTEAEMQAFTDDLIRRGQARLNSTG